MENFQHVGAKLASEKEKLKSSTKVTYDVTERKKGDHGRKQQKSANKEIQEQ